MKGHLDTEQLKQYSFKDLQKLAKDMGVSASGKADDIIARIAAVEVDVPDEPEAQLTDEEMAELGDEQDAATGDEQAAEQQAIPQGDGVVVKAIQDYYSLVLERTVKRGETLNTTAERAALLVSLKLVKTVE